MSSLSSLNWCGDLLGVRFGTVHFHVALQHWVTLGWCRQWQHGRGSTLRSSGLLSLPPRTPYTSPPHSTSTRGRGAARRTPPPRSPRRPSLLKPPWQRLPTSWQTPWRPQRHPHTFRQ